MNSKSIKKLIKSIIFVVLFATMLAVLCEVFTPKTSDLQGGMTNPNARGFYGERKNSIDLLVLGDSNAYCAYSPIVYMEEIWYTIICSSRGKPKYRGCTKYTR